MVYSFYALQELAAIRQQEEEAMAVALYVVRPSHLDLLIPSITAGFSYILSCTHPRYPNNGTQTIKKMPRALNPYENSFQYMCSILTGIELNKLIYTTFNGDLKA